MHLMPRLTIGDRGVEVSDRAVRWLESQRDERPFLLWLHYIDPHGPYGGAAGSRSKSFRGETSFGGAFADDGDGRISPEPARLRSGEIRLDDDEKQAMRALYREEVAEVDRQVGRVLDALHARGLASDTLVVVVSDHGEEFWDHGGVEHGHTLYDELLRAVWIMRWPGHLPAARRIESVASTVDVAPTVDELCGLHAVRVTDGISLVPALRGDATPARPRGTERDLLFAEERVAIRTDTAKLIRWANGKEEAYDLVRDPGERCDLDGTDAFVAPLRATFDDVEQATGPAVAPVQAAAIPAAALRALGYVE